MSIQEQQQARYASISENKLVWTIGLINFVNTVDFIMVMPLGPDFARALNIPVHQIGLIGGIYAFAAAFAGLIGSFFLDNYSRKKVVLFFMISLSIATLGGALAWNMTSMLGARILAGLFGGPLISQGMAFIADYVPPQRRGTAMGKVMGSFSMASIIGIPFGLQLAQWFSWHVPFIATSIMGMIAFAYGIYALPYHPPFINHVSLKQRLRAIGLLLRSKIVLLSFVLVFFSMAAAFSIIPNMSAHLQMNLNYPRSNLGLLYFVGGLLSLFTMRLTGVWVDKTSAGYVSIFSTLLFILIMLGGFIYTSSPMPAMVIFVGFMLAITTRNICGQTVFSKIPPPELRGAYSSLQIALTHLMQALAAYISSLILVEQNGRLLHMDTLAWMAIGASVFIPAMFYYIETHLKRVN